MTLILKLGLDIVKMYLHTKNEVSMSRKNYSLNRQKHGQTDRNTDRQTEKWTDRQTETDRQTDMTENITYPHTQVVIREIFEKKLFHRTLQNQGSEVS